MKGLNPTTESDTRDPIKAVRHAKKRKLLVYISTTANILRACELAGVHRDSHYAWLDSDPLYQAAFSVAMDRGIDALEAEATRRAFDGVVKPVYNNGKRAVDVKVDDKGQVVLKDGKPIAIPATIREYSDGLAMFLLKGRRPERYRERISMDSRFVDQQGKDRPFLLSDADRLIAEADAEEAAGGAV